MAIASSSFDGSVRIVYDFLEKAPRSDVVIELYDLDKSQV
jgi:hypothetical protein